MGTGRMIQSARTWRTRKDKDKDKEGINKKKKAKNAFLICETKHSVLGTLLKLRIESRRRGVFDSALAAVLEISGTRSTRTS